MTKVITAGLPRDDVHVQPLPGSYADELPPACDVADTGPIARWLRSASTILLGAPDPGEEGTDRDGFRNGSAVIVVHVENDEQAVRVSEWMLEWGAFDVEDRTSGWRPVGHE